jgi:VWFA-related protein
VTSLAHRVLRGAAFVLIAAAALLHANAQQPPPTFRSATRLVVQTVSVKDKDGKPIEGLTAQDFTLTEDGEPQEISFVEFQRLDTEATGFPTVTPAAPGPTLAPAAAGQQPAAGGATGTNAAAAPTPIPSAAAAGSPMSEIRYRDRRLIVLYFDVTAMPPADQARAYSAALKYLDEQIRPMDLVAIMSFQGGGVRFRQDFTDNKEALREAMTRLIYNDDLNGDGIPDTTVDMNTAFGQDDGEFNIFNTDRQLSALQTALSMLKPLPEQKSLVYFASGLRMNGVDNQAQFRATVNSAIRANVAIFPVDARGLVASAPLGDATQRSPGGLAAFNGQFAGQMASAFQRSQDTLYALAKDTGGKAMFDDNDLSRGIVAAANAQSSYYVLGYYTNKIAKDGKFHRIKVTLNGGRSADLSYRQGYYSDKEFAKFTAADKERQLEDALRLEDPITEITIAMELNYFRLNSAEYFIPVAVKIPGSELALAKKGGSQRTLIDFIGEVKDDYGNTIQNVRDKLDIALSNDTVAQLATRPIQYETGFTLLPGNYVIKVLARDSETGRIGTYMMSFNVPNLNREAVRLPISSVVLASQRVPISDAIFNVKQKIDANVANPLISDAGKLVPSVTRVFSRSRDLYVYLQAYEREATTIEPLIAFATFYQNDQKVFETSPMSIADGLQPRSKAVPLSFTVSLGQLPPGMYDCQVTVLDPTSQKAAFWRAPIAVVQ